MPLFCVAKGGEGTFKSSHPQHDTPDSCGSSKEETENNSTFMSSANGTADAKEAPSQASYLLSASRKKHVAFL